jgi:hypothetical protein
MGTGWYSKDLGDALMAHVERAQIEAAAQSARKAMPPGGEFALFIRHNSEGRLHCAVTVYFSPGAGPLAQQCGAVRCPRPSRGGLELLCGEPGSWNLLADPAG